MCEACYWKYTRGVHPEVTGEMVRARELKDQLYATEWGCTGGPLHTIVDDMNVDDESFGDSGREYEWIDRGYEEMCLRADPAGMPHPADEGYDDAAKDLCRRLFDALKGMTVQERAWVTRW